MRFESFFRNIVKFPFINKSGETVPPYGALKIGRYSTSGDSGSSQFSTSDTILPDGTFVAYKHTHEHETSSETEGFHDPLEFFTNETAPVTVPYDRRISEWATAWNIGVPVGPNMRGLCYFSLPAIARLSARCLIGYDVRWGDVLCVDPGTFGLIYAMQDFTPAFPNQYPFEADTIANGWPALGRIPSKIDPENPFENRLVVITGQISFGPSPVKSGGTYS